MKAFVIFKVEGNQDRVDEAVRELLNKWSRESDENSQVLLKIHAEVSLENLDTEFAEALKRRSATINQIVHKDSPIPYPCR